MAGPRSVRGIPDATWARWVEDAQAHGEDIGAYIIRRVEREMSPADVRAAVAKLRTLVTTIDDAASDAQDAMDALDNRIGEGDLS